MHDCLTCYGEDQFLPTSCLLYREAHCIIAVL